MENINLQKINSEQRYNFTILDNEIFFDNRLNIYQKHLLWFFNIVSINKDYSHYSIKKIALITKISEATIIRNIPTLIELGYLEKIQKKLQNGFNQNYYFLKPIKKVDFKTLIKQYNTLSDSKSTDCLTDSVHTVSQQVYTLSDSKLNNINYNNINKEECVHTPIDNSYYDITTNTYTNVEPKTKNEYEDFELLFIQAFNTLTVSACSELFQLTGFRAEDKRQRLKEIFNMRKYDYKKCINKAISEAQKTPANKRWFNFLDFLKDYLINGYNGIVESNLQPSHSQSYEDYIREEQERKINKQIELENEAKSKGITVAELEAENEKEIDKGIDDIKNMLGFGSLSEAIENSTIGIKEVPKGKEYKPTPYIQKELSKEDETQIQDLIKKARENSKHNKS